jgi:serine/threonine protein kinase
MRTTATSSAIDHEATLVALTRGKMLADYSNLKRIGKKTSRSGYYGANSVVIQATLDGYEGELALKALVTSAVDQTNALQVRFEAELEIGDATKGRLPPSPHLVRTVCTFLDDVSLSPGWSALQATFSGSLADRTFVCVMPFFPLTLKSVVTMARRGDHPRINERVALTWFVQIIIGAKHLFDHGIAHRDLKLDNVMMSGEDDPLDRLIVIMDFGEALDFVEDGEVDWEMPCTKGCSKGGAPITIPPEVMAVKPGRHAIANYIGTDAWALGRLLNDMLREGAPYTTKTHSAMNADSFVALGDGWSPALRDLHAGLLRVDLSERLTLDAALAFAQEALDAIVVPTITVRAMSSGETWVLEASATTTFGELKTTMQAEHDGGLPSEQLFHRGGDARTGEEALNRGLRVAQAMRDVEARGAPRSPHERGCHCAGERLEDDVVARPLCVVGCRAAERVSEDAVPRVAADAHYDGEEDGHPGGRCVGGVRE